MAPRFVSAHVKITIFFNKAKNKTPPARRNPARSCGGTAFLFIPIACRIQFAILSLDELRALIVLPCGHVDFVFWGSYPRKGLPGTLIILIPRIRCKNCLVTHAVLPIFLLGQVRYTIQTLAPYLEQAVRHSLRPIKVNPKDLSRALSPRAASAKAAAPLNPMMLCGSGFWLSTKLLAVSGKLLRHKPKITPLAFLNYFSWQKTGAALLSTKDASRPP